MILVAFFVLDILTILKFDQLLVKNYLALKFLNLQNSLLNALFGTRIELIANILLLLENLLLHP